MSNGQIGQDKKKIVFEEIPEDRQEGGVTFEEIAEPSVSETPSLEDLIGSINPELLRTISQAQATFAPEATFVSPEAFKETKPRGVGEKPGVITLDDVFNGEILSTLPIASRTVRDVSDFANFRATGIRSLKGPIGRGVVGGTVRMAMNMTEALIKKPAETVVSFITAIPLLTFKALQGFIEDTALPNITVAGNEDALELVREKFADIIGATPIIGGGRMSPDQMNEAHRGFKAVLAAAATGKLLFLGTESAALGFFMRIGVPAAQAAKRSKLLRLQISATGALGTFGAVGGDPEEMEKNFVAFALASIPLGLMFHTFGAIGRPTPKVNSLVRASEYQQQRAARPFNQETVVVPEVRIADPARLLGKGRDEPVRVPLGEEVVRPEVKEVTPIEEAATRLGVERKEAVSRTTGEVVGLVREEASKPGEVVGEIAPLELGPKEPKPLNPDVLAERLDNYVQHQGDEVAVIIQNLNNAESKMVVVPGAETPARALELAKEIAGEDVIVAVHLRPDGRFDVAVGKKGSSLDNSNNFKQFTSEGFFAGQKISVNGKDLVYIGKSGNQSFVRVAGDPRLVKINTKDIRKLKDVGTDVKSEVKVGTLKPLEDFAFTRPTERQNLGDITPTLFRETDVQGALELSPHGRVTAEQIDLHFSNTPDLALGQGANRGFLLEFDAAGINGRINTSKPAWEIAYNNGAAEFISALGESQSKFQRALKSITIRNDAKSSNVDTKRMNRTIESLKNDGWVETQTSDGHKLTRPKEIAKQSAEKQLEEVITPEEIEVFKSLREEVNPVEPSTEPKTFDQIRQEASTNGLELTRTAANTFVIRDRATGQELFAGPTKEDAEAFINNIGQDETMVFDGDIPIDIDIPGNVMPPPPPGLRVNEPFDFPPNTKVGTIVDLFQSLTPFITPFKDWAAAVDNILGTRILSEVYLRTQEPQGRSLSRAMPWLEKLKKIEKIAVDAGLSPQQMEQVFDYIQTRSPEDLRGSHLKGLGPLKNRSMTEDELSSADLLLELDVDTYRLYEYIRLRNQLFFAEAQSLKINIESLDPVIKKAIEDEIIDNKDMTPNEMAGVEIFDHIRAQDLNELALDVVTRLVEATKVGALSQADFAAKNNMSAAQIRIANEIVKLQDEIAAIPDVPIDDAQLIRGYMAHYAQHQTASPEGSILNQGGVSRDRAFVNSMIRSGETNVYDRNPIAVTARYIKNAFDAIEFNDAWNDAKRYVDKELGGQFGREGSVASWVAKSYLSDIRGIPDAATKFTQQVVDAFFKKMGWKIELNVRRDIVNTYLAMTNAAFMGARPGLAARDLMQLSIFHYSRFGGVVGKRTMRMLTLAWKLDQEGTKQLRDAGELPTIGIVEFETAKELEASAIGKTMKGLPAMTRKIAEVGLTASGQRNAYEFGYKGVLLEARETAMRELSNFVDGKITQEEAYKRIELDTYNLQTKKAFDAFVVNGEYERAANFLGQQTAREIMGVYGRANHPWGWGTNLGRLITHYGTWSSNALAFTLGGMSRGSKKQRAAFVARFAMTQAGLQAAGNSVGLNVHSWLVLPGLFFTGGPAVQTADLIITALTGYGVEKDMAKKRIMQLFPAWNDPRSMFIPFSYVVGDLVKTLDADNPIEFFGRAFSIPLKRGRSWLDDF